MTNSSKTDSQAAQKRNQQYNDKTAEEKVADAQAAALALSNLSTARRNEALTAIADTIEANTDRILEANAADVADAEKQVEAGEYTQAFVDRLMLSESKLKVLLKWFAVLPSKMTHLVRHLQQGSLMPI
jgi:Gamma-glutamyl phosphate reductase